MARLRLASKALKCKMCCSTKNTTQYDIICRLAEAQYSILKGIQTRVRKSCLFAAEGMLASQLVLWAKPITKDYIRVEHKLHSISKLFISQVIIPCHVFFKPIYVPWALNMDDSRIFHVPKVCRRILGERSFQYNRPVIWNSLPFSVRHAMSLSSFKSKLKTHLFSSAYWFIIYHFLSSLSIKPMATMLVF